MTEQEYNQAVAQGQVTMVTPTDIPADDTTPTFDLSQYEPLLQSLRLPRKYLTAVPTFVPKTYADSFQFVDDGVKKLCVYFEGNWQVIGITGTGLSRVRVGLSANTSAIGAQQIGFDTVYFDTNNEFDAASSHQFTPKVAGYYQVYATAYFSGGTNDYQYALKIYKNNAEVSESNKIKVNASDNPFTIAVSDIVYLTPSDHLDIYGYTNALSSVTINYGSTITYATIQQLS